MSSGREKSVKSSSSINLRLASVSLFSPPTLLTKCEKRELGFLSPDHEKDQAKSIKVSTPFYSNWDPSKNKLLNGLPPIHINNPEQQFYTGKLRSKWEWDEFSPAARNDNLRLFRWKKNSDTEVVDPNLKHHVQLNIPSFTDEIYEKHLISDDWSLEDTRQLFDLCRKFDLRFLVVHDRFLSSDKPRTVEDLKARFYEITNVLSEIQKKGNQESASAFPIVSFDKEKESQRKKHLEGLYSRSREAIDEEENLVFMIRRLRNEGRSFIRKREQLLQILNAAPPSANSGMTQKELKASLQSSEHAAGPPVKRKRKIIKRVSASAQADGDVHSSEEKKPAQQVAKVETDQENTRDILDLKHIPDPFVPGVALRSSTVTQTPAPIPDSIASFLAAFGIGTLPKMPTELVCEKFDEVQSLLAEVLEARKHLEQLGATFSPADGAASNAAIELVTHNSDKAYERKKSISHGETVREKKRFRGD
ncbi:swr complex subunit [Entomophthora muscae]|uniref:Swr complex subunit n=1 Tax=Entomophthora muscae TaxID=34485 RepID=A0ACC2TZ82_9FUNG|nr:swr complex subunit [Entomophthora muscae]